MRAEELGENLEQFPDVTGKPEVSQMSKMAFSSQLLHTMSKLLSDRIDRINSVWQSIERQRHQSGVSACKRGPTT